MEDFSVVYLKKTDLLETEEIIKEEFDKVFKRENLTYRSISSRNELRKVLLTLDEQYREVFIRELGGTPLLSYRILEGATDTELKIRIQRESNLQVKLYKDFKIILLLTSLEVEETKQFFEKQKELYCKLVRENLILQNIFYLNDCVSKNLKAIQSPFEVSFTPDVFSDNTLEFISEDKLVLTANSDNMFNVLSHISSLNELEFDVYNKQEEDCFAIYHSTVEILGRRTPMINSLLKNNRINLKKILRSPFSKTLLQMQIYPKAIGTACYLENDIFAVVKRSEYGTTISLPPINIKTFMNETDFDVLKLLERNN